MGGEELSAAALQIGAENGRVPTTARRDFDDRVGRLHAEKGECLDGMAPCIARPFLLEAPGAGNRGFQRVGRRGRDSSLSRGCARRGVPAAAAGKPEGCDSQQKVT